MNTGKQNQRNDPRCKQCGEYPDREGDFRSWFWSNVGKARDLDLTSYFAHSKFFMSVTRNDENVQFSAYRKALDERRQRDQDDQRDSEIARKLGYDEDHALLILFPKGVDINPDAMFWIRKLVGIPSLEIDWYGGWKRLTQQELIEKLA
jgi:hypothetical protein